MTYLKTDDDTYVKDGSNGAVLNTNNTAYQAFRRQRDTAKSAQRLQEEVEMLKSEMNEIKQLLKMISERV